MLRQLVGLMIGCSAGSTLVAAAQKKCVLEPNGSGGKERVCYRFVNEERVLDKVTVEPANGGINPAMRAYEIEGQVQIAGNSCQAQGLQTTFEERLIQGQKYAVALVSGWQREDLVCIEVYQPVRAPVQLTLRGPQTELEKIRIKNVGEKGLDVALNSPCLRPKNCPEGGQPSVCYFDELEFYGDSLCQAEADARKNACLKGVDLDRVICEDSVPRL